MLADSVTSLRITAAGFGQEALRLRRLGCILMLALALLVTQWLGLWHAIAHAGWPPSTGQAASMSISEALFGDADDGKPGNAHAGHHHSCIEYDAASGAAGIHVPFFSPPLIPGPQVLALLQAFASWDAPAVCPFSSRAPPR